MGTAAFVYTTQICGSVPLFRLYNVAGTDHFYTKRAAFLASGLIDQGIAAYVPLGGIIPGVPFC
ncbi:hypothetical protein B0H14DRAFT_2497364 [Mycena olivaceomarginata]|nr:hypothetical protein B0H14DRAFT_2497364 [Mycena olivaceomarginata]